MTTKNEAAPRPWRAVFHETNQRTGNGQWVFVGPDGNAHLSAGRVGEANAAFIVEAVNAHDAMRELECAAIEVVQVEELRRRGTLTCERYEAAFKALRAALGKVEIAR